MKKILVLITILGMQGITEMNAMKGTFGKKPTGAKGASQGKPVAAKSKGPTEAQKKALKVEAIKVMEDMKKYSDRLHNLALSTGNYDDAKAFIKEINDTLEASNEVFNKKLKELEKKVDALPTKEELLAQNQPGLGQLSEKNKEYLLALATNWKKDEVMEKYQEYLNNNNLKFDDAFSNELYNVAK